METKTRRGPYPSKKKPSPERGGKRKKLKKKPVMTKKRISIALQKTGRMAEDSLNLLKNCGLHVDRSKDQLFCRIKELPIDLLLVRDDDIPGFVSNGICDLGIVGENVYAEMKAAGNGGFSAD